MESRANQSTFDDDELQAQAMINEGAPVAGSVPSAVERARSRWSGAGPTSRRRDVVTRTRHWVSDGLEKLSAALGRQYLERLARKGRVSESLGSVPRRMHKVANQAALLLELIDDFKDGTYREVPWRTVAIASAGVLYAVSPADVIPDYIPILGTLDDLALLAVATRFIDEDLRAYCRFKGYDEAEYF